MTVNAECRPITAEDVSGIPGLRRDVVAELLRRQPHTVRDALSIPGVGRATTRRLMERGLLVDLDCVQRGITSRRAKPNWPPRSRPIRDDHLRGIPSLNQRTKAILLAAQPQTVLQALQIVGIGYGITGLLLEREILTDPDEAQL